MDAVNLLRPVAGEVEAGTSKVVGGDILEDAGLLLQSTNLGMEATAPLPSGEVTRNSNNAIRVRVGERLEQTASTTVKIAVLMPMPSARAATAAKVNPGFARNMRTACLNVVPEIGHEATPLFTTPCDTDSICALY